MYTNKKGDVLFLKEENALPIEERKKKQQVWHKENLLVSSFTNYRFSFEILVLA